MPTKQFFRQDLGLFVFRVFGTHLIDLHDVPNQDDPDFINPELKEVRRPQWNVNGGIRWQYDRLQVNYGLTYMSNQAYDDVEIETATQTFVNPFAGDFFIHNISANFEVYDQIFVYGGINNLFAADPLGTSTSFPVSPLGRTFFLGVNSTL